MATRRWICPGIFRRAADSLGGFPWRAMPSMMAHPGQERTMAVGREIKRRLKAAIAPVFFLALALYFGWSATRGPHGLVEYQQRKVQLAQAQADLAKLQAEQTDWERRVA